MTLTTVNTTDLQTGDVVVGSGRTVTFAETDTGSNVRVLWTTGSADGESLFRANATVVVKRAVAA